MVFQKNVGGFEGFFLGMSETGAINDLAKQLAALMERMGPHTSKASELKEAKSAIISRIKDIMIIHQLNRIETPGFVIELKVINHAARIDNAIVFDSLVFVLGSERADEIQRVMDRIKEVRKERSKEDIRIKITPTGGS